MTRQEDPRPTIGEFAERLSERTAAMSTRALAQRSGWSRSTISELRSGRRLPTDQQLADILGAVGADAAEIIDFKQLRRNCVQPAVVSSLAIDKGEPDRPDARGGATAIAVPMLTKRWRPSGPIVAVMAILLAASGGFVVGRATAAPSGEVAPTPAVVANTANLGVMTYTGPSRDHRAPGTIPEGTRILIVCQVGDGEPLTDRVGDMVITWPVWDKLDDGRWIPDIYTSTGKDYRPTATATALLTC